MNQPKQKTAKKELTFVRHLEAIKSEDKTSLVCQPYLTGMYVIIDNKHQMSFSHKQYEKWIKGSIKKMEKNGYEVTFYEQPFTDYFSQEDIDNYIK